jgi:phytoene dehydrogenase-like protein
VPTVDGEEAPVSGSEVDAVVVGSGPNGLVAAITLARAGRSVLVLEGEDTLGGGARSAELTLPGFVHDICSAIHPLGAGSPAMQSLPLATHGLRWVQPEVALAHPLDGGRAGVVERDVALTARRLGGDARAWCRHVGSQADHWGDLAPMLTRPLPQIPRHPLTLARFGIPALAPANWLGERWFAGEEARALFAGCAAHAFLPLSRALTASFGLVLLASAHAVGWPVAEGGSQRIADALVSVLRSHGGRVETGRPVTSLAGLPPSRAVLFDVSPRQVASIAGDHLPPGFRRRLQRFRHGPGSFKVDYALAGPVPWINEDCRRAGTVHVGGSATEVAAAVAEVAAGRHAERPFVLVAQQSLVDPSRAPAGHHTLWAYCHVPNGSTVDMTAAIDAQIERFAPGFGDLVLARHVAGPAWFEGHDAAFIGGDIAGGANDRLQLLFRPVIGRPYLTPNPSLLMCSASTPPGGGVHGMCGFHAAQAALRGVLR